MPNYLSPGVYVEEVEAGSRPIEGVGTAVAAFVGLAATGPHNAPTLITNWAQFVNTFGDFMEGSYLAHAVYGYFLNGGGACYVVRIGGDQPMPAARAEIATAKDEKLAGYRITALEPGPAGNHITVEVGEAGDPAEDTFKLTVKRARTRYRDLRQRDHQARQEQRRDDGQGAVQADRDRGDRHRRSARAGTRQGQGARSPAPTAPNQSASRPRTTSATPPTAPASAGSRRSTTITMVARARPDGGLPARAPSTSRGVQAVQLAMIAHCELMGDRVAILDPPPGLNAQQMREWRVDKAGYDSKYATLYWPWIKVFDPAAGRACRPAERPHGRHLGAQRRRPRRAQGAGQRGRSAARVGAGDAAHQGRARPAQPGRRQLHPGLPRPRHPRLGRAHPVAATRPGATSTCAGSSTTSRSRSSTAPSGSSSSRTTRPCGPRVRRTISAFLATEWRDGALFGAHAGRGLLRQVRRGDQPAGGHRRRAGGLSRSASRRSSRPSSSSSASRSSRAARAWSPSSAPSGDRHFDRTHRRSRP